MLVVFLFFFLLSITHIENICSDSFRKKYYFCNKLLKPRNEENTHRTFATYHHSYYTWYRYRKFPADTFGTAVRDLQLHLENSSISPYLLSFSDWLPLP